MKVLSHSSKRRELSGRPMKDVRMDSEHSCHGHPSVRGCFCFQLGAGAGDDVGGLSRDTLVIRAETRAFGALTHPALPGSGHSRSWHRRQVIKVPSDSSDEAAGDKRPPAAGVIPVDCQSSKGAAAACDAAHTTSVLLEKLNNCY